jgi:hypothetical protein
MSLKLKFGFYEIKGLTNHNLRTTGSKTTQKIVE